MSYAAYRATKIESGLLYQDFVVDVLHQTVGISVNQYASRFYQTQIGESRTGIEIKHDEKYSCTGNLWIELAEKAVPRPGVYASSGIKRDDNSWLYVIGNYDIIFAFPKVYLLALSESGRYQQRENRTKTSVGFLLPDAHARKYAAFILTPNAEQVVAKAITDLHALGKLLHKSALSDPAQRSLFIEQERIEQPV